MTHNGMVCLAEDKMFQLVYDSAGMDEVQVEAKPQEVDDQEKPPAFYWLQSVEEMVVWVMLPQKINKKEIKVHLKPSHMSVKIKACGPCLVYKMASNCKQTADF